MDTARVVVLTDASLGDIRGMRYLLGFFVQLLEKAGKENLVQYASNR